MNSMEALVGQTSEGLLASVDSQLYSDSNCEYSLTLSTQTISVSSCPPNFRVHESSLIMLIEYMSKKPAKPGVIVSLSKTTISAVGIVINVPISVDQISILEN